MPIYLLCEAFYFTVMSASIQSWNFPPSQRTDDTTDNAIQIATPDENKMDKCSSDAH